MSSEEEVVALLGGGVGIGEIDIVERESAFAAVFVSVIASAMKDDFTIVLFGKLFAGLVVGFVEPPIEIIGGLDGVITGNVGCEDVVIGSPSVDVVGISWNRKTVDSELVADDIANNALAIESTSGPFKLTVGVATIIFALIPISDWNSDGLGVAKRGGLPRSGDAIFIGDGFERHSPNNGRDADNSQNQK